MKRAACLLAFSLLSDMAFGAEGVLLPRPIPSFGPANADAPHSGAMLFEAGFSLTSGAETFGGISAFRYFDEGRSIIGVTDEGNWFFARVERDALGRPTRLSDLAMQPLLDLKGRPFTHKRDADSEGMTIIGDEVWVSFERRARVLRYKFQPRRMGFALGEVDFIIPPHDLRKNRGMEALTLAPVNSGFGAHPVVISERSLDASGSIFAAILRGPRKGVFKIKRTNEFDITDAAFLPDGRLLVLERRFSMIGGVAMRMRRLDLSKAQNAPYDGEILLEANMNKSIDNMEALDVFKRADGKIVVGVMSDDNFSFFQRNLYLEFTLGN
ncbi:esterase-like activity of phytase family protein [Limoniibacter endophyticus]|uniref:Phytase-like domain-containing protein n=1 Tax=Limoniibacter endophyticus TaxID=1565040 RepID=A0A8J3GH36_9HYPH|nr:esterase-like activity of phytase family protein [Limoniibacter endophyticus]GHC76378.1 hypothetical protein GCM10010136_27030 [Limoniibacter endophyticus]